MFKNVERSFSSQLCDRVTFNLDTEPQGALLQKAFGHPLTRSVAEFVDNLDLRSQNWILTSLPNTTITEDLLHHKYAHWLIELSIGVGILVVIVITVFHYSIHRADGQSILRRARLLQKCVQVAKQGKRAVEAAEEGAPRCTILDSLSPADPMLKDCDVRDCDYVMMFPRRGDGIDNVHIVGTSLMYVEWDGWVDGLKQARAVFQDPNKSHFFSDVELHGRFQERMTVEDYHENVRALLVEFLAGPCLGLELEAFVSVGKNEIFLKLRLPDDNTTLKALALEFHYLMPLNDDAYNAAQVAVPRDKHGNHIYAHIEYTSQNDKWFQEFRNVDRLRLLSNRIQKYVNLEELSTQNVLTAHFPAHHWQDIVNLSDFWGNQFLFFFIPTPETEAVVRDYFGEKVTWMFVWQAYYAKMLLGPAFIGSIFFFRRYFLTAHQQNYVQILFAVLMCFWVMFFNVSYRRYERRVQARWGNHQVEEDIGVRDEYRYDLEGTWRVKMIKFLGHILGACVVGLVVLGTVALHLLRQYMEKEHASWLFAKLGALLVTAQILVLDQLWLAVSRWVVNHENHQTQQQWNNAWVQRLFFVRLFSNLFPFLFLSLRRHLPGVMCPETESELGCLDDLEPALVVYFLARVTGRFVCNMTLVIFENRQIYNELKTLENRNRPYTYVEIQSKCRDYEQSLQMDDWTDMVMTFAFLSCFNVIVPVIAPVALVTSIIHMRCMANRNCHVLKRPLPVCTSGIGGFQVLMDHIEVMAVVVNLGMAIFAMHPLRDLPMNIKWLIFVGLQYFMCLMKVVLLGEFPEWPSDIVSCRRQNKNMLRRLIDGFQQSPDFLVKSPVTKHLPRIGPRSQGSFG
eukprot:gnl/MRDRNA2_/MRDRNA2_109293_c0_seq1.p1 gnl/MRDRNA2_/MRDRNA2_109293_c0~~gnl/MRDRNA2_/MRDRNA2_109293_c0_seq1.p1  ORF type:complete len:851 (+),score=96.41 gnl/MRDRNA2_/MRDRNA2_109293_c0_seq1:48-2600(+)